MYHILVDTCVWLDLAKDTKQQPLLDVLEELIDRGEVTLIVPRTVYDEFQRNKERITQESRRSLSAHFKLVKDAVTKFGDQRRKKSILQQLNDINHKLPLISESTATGSLNRIENLLKKSITEITDEIKLRAAQRAIDGKAPFHRNKNSIGDAVIIETYGACVNDSAGKGKRFAFVTHNKSDFSIPGGNEKEPHPDMADLFTPRRSRYFTKFADALRKVDAFLVTATMAMDERIFEPRGLSDLLDAEHELMEKVWYNRHKNRECKIEEGIITIIDREQFASARSTKDVIVRDIWEGAKKSAKHVERKYGFENLGPWDDFEWGMLNGKLSALRWVLGEDWDELYT